MKRIAVLISGNGTNLQALIDAGASEVLPAKIVLVISNRGSAYGLHRAAAGRDSDALLPLAALSGRGPDVCCL